MWKVWEKEKEVVVRKLEVGVLCDQGHEEEEEGQS
jgi:hypothetical protein